MGYTILERENGPEILKKKPRWMACAIIALTTLAVTTSAVAAGVFVGYTYCYLEHRHNMAADNLTHESNFQLLKLPLLPEKPRPNITINSAMSSILVARLAGFRNSFQDEEIPTVSWTDDLPGVIHPTL